MEDVFIYIVDTATLWTIYGGLTDSQARPLFAPTRPSPDAAADVARLAIEVAQARSAQASDPDGQTALRAVAQYLGKTQTYGQVVAGSAGSVRGHWMALCYAYRNGGSTLRPVFVSMGTPAAPLDAQEFLQTLVQAIRHDVHGPASKLQKHIQAQGGLELAPRLAERIRLH